MEKNKTLVIVESPTKAKTINKYLGKDYVVKSSMGHLIDLPKSRLAVDVENGFEPDYITIRGRGRILNELRREAHRSGRVLLAADSDREGEAISYHIKNALEQSNPRSEIKRIIFHEITKNAIEEAIKNPRDIDMALVEAQKARRVLDRLVGYNLSPLLWEKIKKGLSAGRVQSVALKVICEREDEIEAFVPEEYWTIEAEFKRGKKKFSAKLISFGGEKAEIHSEEEAEKILQHVRGKDFVVVEVEEKERRRKPTAPFTTSKLQQAAGSKLGFPARKTMMVAQQLYEGIAVDEGPVGLITYMRTDSTRIAELAQKEAIKYISEHFSEAYLPPKPNVYVNREGAQDAHEAIRPTSVYRTPERLRPYLTRDQLRLYTLIWEQFIASQMNGAVFKQVRVDIQAGEAVFRANGQEVMFDGFLRVLGMEEDEGERVLPELLKGEVLVPEKIEKEVHYTEPPARYTDATLVKFLEESGIGRPSTYAPIISTLIARYYVERDKRQLKPTFLGRLVNDLMVKSFPELLDINFTSNMESKLDEIAEGKLHWVQLLREFYGPFIELVESAQKKLESYRGITDEETEYVCEKCGRSMVKRLGKYGYFLACPGFPECRNAKPLPYGKCPRDGCDGLVVERKTKRKRSFYGCSRYPECDFMTWDKPASMVCPRCGSITAEKDFDGKRYLICLRESCGYRESLEDEKPEKVLVRT